MKSLFESLNLADLTTPDAEPDPLLVLTGKAFSKAVLESVQFREYVVRGLLLRDIPPAVLCRLMDHGWGKPPDRIEHTLDDRSLENMTPERVREKLVHAQRLLQLLEAAQTEDTFHTVVH